LRGGIFEASLYEIHHPAKRFFLLFAFPVKKKTLSGMKTLLSLIFTAYSVVSIAFPIVHSLEAERDFSVEADCEHAGFVSTEIIDGRNQNACADFIRNSVSDRTRPNEAKTPETNDVANPVPFAVFHFHTALSARSLPPRATIRPQYPPTLVGIVKIQT
jgi:hypothetical protein